VSCSREKGVHAIGDEAIIGILGLPETDCTADMSSGLNCGDLGCVCAGLHLCQLRRGAPHCCICFLDVLLMLGTVFAQRAWRKVMKVIPISVAVLLLLLATSPALAQSGGGLSASIETGYGLT
jgi:hypothetical protein